MNFASYLVARDFEAAVEGFVQTDPSPDARMAAIVARFREVAALNPASASPIDPATPRTPPRREPRNTPKRNSDELNPSANAPG